jgi:hypothetical protein
MKMKYVGFCSYELLNRKIVLGVGIFWKLGIYIPVKDN